MSELECPCSICPPCRSAYSSQVTFYHTFPLLFFIKLTVPSECLFLQASARCGIRMSTPREQGLRLTYSRTAFSPVTGKCLAHIFTSARNMCGIGAQCRGLPSAPQETALAAGRIASRPRPGVPWSPASASFPDSVPAYFFSLLLSRSLWFSFPQAPGRAQGLCVCHPLPCTLPSLSSFAGPSRV